MDLQTITEHLRTESIVAYLSRIDPLTLARDPYVAVSFLIVMVVLFSLKMLRTAVTILSVVAMWFGIAYAIPKTEIISLGDLGAFIGVCISVLAALVYVYLIRSD